MTRERVKLGILALALAILIHAIVVENPTQIAPEVKPKNKNNQLVSYQSLN